MHTQTRKSSLPDDITKQRGSGSEKVKVRRDWWIRRKGGDGGRSGQVRDPLSGKSNLFPAGTP